MTAGNNLIKKDWPLILLMLISFGAAAYFYPLLPERVPSHWNFQGEIDGYSSRFFGAFGLPLINIGLYILFIVTPYLDPKKANYKYFESSYRMIRMTMHIFMMGIQAIVLAAALGYAINVSLLVKIGVSMIFILIGNVMGRFKFNYFVGIKTPWTYANEEVWRKTHRMAAPIWVIGGIACTATAFWDNYISAAIFFLAIAAMTIVPVAYSYIEYRKLNKQK